MKTPLEEVFEMLEITGFKPVGWESKDPKKKGIYRDYYTKKMPDGRSFLLMSSEYKLNNKQERVGAPDPNKPIWCVLMEDERKEHTWVIQYSNNEGAESKVKGEVIYGEI